MNEPKTCIELRRRPGGEICIGTFYRSARFVASPDVSDRQLTEDRFEEGFGFDASSLRGWAAINESDMLLVPDPSRFWVDPFTEETTICLIANVVDPITKEGYGLDPRSVAVRAESYLKFTGIADTVYFGPEAEFFIFDEVRYHNDQNSAGYSVNSEEGHWNSGRQGDENFPNNGYHIRPKEGYVPVAPLDTLIDIRNTMSMILGKSGLTSNVITMKWRRRGSARSTSNSRIFFNAPTT